MKLNQLGVGTVVVLAFLLAIINLVFSFMFSRMVTPEEENPSVEPQFLSMKSRFMHLYVCTIPSHGCILICGPFL